MGKEKLSQTAKATLMFSLANMIHYGFSILYSPIFTRIMTTEEYGVVVLYGSATNLLMTFLTFNIWGIAYIGFTEFKQDKKGFIASSTLIPLIGVVPFAAVLLLFPAWLSKVFTLPVSMLWFLLLNVLLTAPFQMWTCEKRYEYRYKAVFAVSVLNSASVLFVGVAAVLLFPQAKGQAKIVGSGLIQAVIYLILWVRILWQGLSQVKIRHAKFALKLALPQLPGAIATGLLGQTDRMMIAYMLGEGQAAVYGVGGTLSGAFHSVVISAINATWLPYIIRALDAGKIKDLRKKATQLTFFTAVCCMLLILVVPEAIFVLGGRQYDMAKWCAPPLILTLLFSFIAGLFGNVQDFHRQTQYASIGVLVATAVNISLNYLLIPVLGIVAASYTSLVSQIITCVISYFCMRRVCRNVDADWHIYDLKKLALIGIASVFFGCLGSVVLFPLRWIRFILLGLFGAVVVMNRKKLMKIVQEF